MRLPSLGGIQPSKIFQRPTVSRGAILISLALVAIISAAVMMRIFPAKYGFYLHEFDPYFDYYSSKFLVEHFDQKGIQGLLDYFNWTDYKTWYPEGRPVAQTSQVGLHFAGALLYIVARSIFGVTISLYDFVILLPVIFGALTTIMIYLLVKRLAGAGAGILAGLVIAFSPPIIQRGALGWFKSEPLALFLAVSGSYFYLSIFDERVSRIGLIWRAALSGFLLGYANTAWGGSLYFNVLFGLLFFLAPFLNVNMQKIIYSGSVFTAFNLIFSSIFPRPGPQMISGPAGIILLAGVLFTVIAYRVKTTVDPKLYVRTLIRTLLIFALLGLTILSFGFVTSLSGRYQTVIAPFLRTGNPLVESVAEHFTPTGADYISSYFFLLFLAGFGVIMTFRRRSITSAYILLFGISAIYISSSFARLMVFSSIALAILAGIGLHELTSAFFRPHAAIPLKKRLHLHEVRSEVKVAYSILMVALISFPVAYPSTFNWLETADIPVSLVSASTNFRTRFPDWFEALSWMKDSTPAYQLDGKPTVIASWWDYGYWIAVMGNRTSLADNATLNTTRIAQLGRMFMSNETQAMNILKALKADYVLIFVGGQSFTQGGQRLFLLGAFGDEAKKQWFIKIGGLNANEFLEEDEFTPKPYFWDNTLLGKMMPFQFASYVQISGGQIQFTQDKEYKLGLQTVYLYDLKYPSDSSGPLRLAFMSSSLAEPKDGLFTGVLVYEIVK